MCFIFSCFAWILDCVQRTITFVLTCWMGLILCCGLSIASIAGIAYGYNFCMAEYMTLARSDITIYMRRGKFNDKPDLKQNPQLSARRSGGSDLFEGDEFTANMTADYEEGLRKAQANEPKSLSEAWVKAEDTRKYAERLTKYADKSKTVDDPRIEMLTTHSPYYYITTPPPQSFSVVPILTGTWKMSSPEIATKRFIKQVKTRIHRPETQNPLNSVERSTDVSKESERAVRNWFKWPVKTENPRPDIKTDAVDQSSDERYLEIPVPEDIITAESDDSDYKQYESSASKQTTEFYQR